MTETTTEDLVMRYYNDPVGFTNDCLQVTPKKEQALLLESVRDHKKTTIRSGRGTGKTAGLSFLGWWWLCTRAHCQIGCTANNKTQLRDVLWREMSKWKRQLIEPFSSMFDMTTERIFHKGHAADWFATARTASKERPDALQGLHDDNLLIMADEASGIPAEIFTSLEGSMTGDQNRLIMTGNPLRPQGFFYDSHYKNVRSFNALHFNSEESDLVSASWIEDMKMQYGVESMHYAIHVLGNFPSQSDKQLISLSHLYDAVEREDVNTTGSVVWGLDPAGMGNDKTALAIRHGDEIVEIKTRAKQDTMQVAYWVAAEYESAGNLGRPSRIFVDMIGLGAGVYDRLRELGVPVTGINVGTKSSRPGRFLNFRAELWWKYKEWLESGRAKIPNDDVLIAESSSIEFDYAPNGAIKIESKADMKKRGLESPDRADAVCLCFSAPVVVHTKRGFKQKPKVNRRHDPFKLRSRRRVLGGR